MKKFIFLVISILAISSAAIAGCQGTNTGANDALPDNAYNLVQGGDKDCQPSDSETKTPEPRTPHADKRTSDTDDGNCEVGDCDDSKDKCPHCKPRLPRRPHGNHDKVPVPRPAPVQPKN